jgi:hypothetical protein
VFSFPQVKIALKGKRFQDVEDIKENVKAELNSFLWRHSPTLFKNFLKYSTNVFMWAEITFNSSKTIFYVLVFFISFFTAVTEYFDRKINIF